MWMLKQKCGGYGWRRHEQTGHGLPTADYSISQRHLIGVGTVFIGDGGTT